ncbi:MAG: MBL fold metallo-hydrolase [Acidobacteriota bacterium]|nr:MBL fold metallo-hydrolase [Acidobacteriota bacterium]
MPRLVRTAATLFTTLALGLAACPAPAAAPAAAGALRIYFADVEGGQATLFVTPQGENLLVDTGWPGAGGRDADRIVALCKQAGVTRLDNVLITHFHTDHVGGVPQLAARIPIGRLIDHGDNTETSDPATLAGWQGYQQTLASTHAQRLTVHVGDMLPIRGLHAEVVSGDGHVLQHPLAGGGAGSQNPYCASSPMRPLEDTENDKSLGLMITFGKLRILDLGDLTWAQERPLMCPVDNLGKVDIYIVSHHGMDRSSSPALVDAIAPRVAIMDNGGHKGGSQPAWTVVSASPRIANNAGDLWQLHTAEDSDAAHNVPEQRIANLPGADAGHSLSLTAYRNGSFVVANQRNGASKRYPAQ